MALKKNWTAVKQCLKYCNEKELTGIIQELYKLNHPNKDYLHLRFLATHSKEYKVQLLTDSVETIRKRWASATHDPYGYGGNPISVKITPMKEPVIAYKKAIGIDEGYLTVLSAYIIYGHKFLKTHCGAEPAEVVVHSINVMAIELFTLVEKRPEHLTQLPPEALPEIRKFVNDYEAYHDTKVHFRQIEPLLSSY
ncbi:MAG: hypothetical protein GY821_07290 [Gammaproteobacteria bacterium]|nr:hypothetical protein [Gammaproteobacteria bacterium]